MIIDVGDIVQLEYIHSLPRVGKVLHLPQNTGDMWYIEEVSENGRNIIYAQNPTSSELVRIILERKDPDAIPF